jgi:hypothetical protein
VAARVQLVHACAMVEANGHVLVAARVQLVHACAMAEANGHVLVLLKYF